MLDHVRERPAVQLGAQQYLDDFWRHNEHIDGDFWKLERIQTFREPEEPAWVAMEAGDWHRALALIEARRRAPTPVAAASKQSSHRLRIVESPITPYLQWELHALRVKVEEGSQDIRVLDAARIRHLETRSPLPELVFLGTAVMYEVLYDDTGAHSGGRRHEDPETITACLRELTELHARGEDLLPYFHREIAPLPPPMVDH